MKFKKINSYFSVHYSFIVLMIFAALFGLGLLLFEYFVSLVLHEIVHAYFAKKRGYKIGKIKLLATGAMLEAESDEFGFADEIVISISGPLFNLIVALALIMSWWVWPESYNFTQDLCVINLAIFGFNILPIFPLDGGRVLLALLSKKGDRPLAIKITKAITIFFAFVLFLLFVISLFISPNFSFGLVSLSLLFSSFDSDKNTAYKRLLFLPRKIERTKTAGIECRFVCVSSSLDKRRLLKLIDAKHYTTFIRVDDNFKIVETLSESQLYRELDIG